MFLYNQEAKKRREKVMFSENICIGVGGTEVLIIMFRSYCYYFSPQVSLSVCCSVFLLISLACVSYCRYIMQWWIEELLLFQLSHRSLLMSSSFPSPEWENNIMCKHKHRKRTRFFIPEYKLEPQTQEKERKNLNEFTQEASQEGVVCIICLFHYSRL